MTDSVISPDGKFIWVGGEWLPINKNGNLTDESITQNSRNEPQGDFKNPSTNVTFEDSVMTGNVNITNNNIEDISKAVLSVLSDIRSNHILRRFSRIDPPKADLIDLHGVTLSIPKLTYINKLEKARSNSNNEETAKFLFYLGMYSSLEDNYIEAKRYFYECIGFSKEVHSEDFLTKSAIELVNILQMNDNYEEAEDLFNQIILNHETYINNKKLQTEFLDSFISLIDQMIDNSLFQDADRIYKIMLDNESAIQDEIIRANIYYKIGSLHMNTEIIIFDDDWFFPDNTYGEKMLENGLEIFRKNNDLSGQIESLIRLADSRFGVDFGKKYNQILDLAIQKSDHLCQGFALFKLGENSEWLDDRVTADKYYNKCEQITNRYGFGEEDKLILSSKRAMNLYKMGEDVEVERLFEDILHSSRQLNILKYEAYSLFYLGLISYHNVSLDETKRLFRECYAISSEIDEPTITAELYIRLGIFAHKDGDEEAMNEYFQLAKFGINNNEIDPNELGIEEVLEYTMWDLFSNSGFF